jgi:hypothetical protein
LAGLDISQREDARQTISPNANISCSTLCFGRRIHLVVHKPRHKTPGAYIGNRVAARGGRVAGMKASTSDCRRAPHDWAVRKGECPLCVLIQAGFR